MQKWIEKHDEEWKETMRRAHKKRQGTPTMSLTWISDQVRKAQAKVKKIVGDLLVIKLKYLKGMNQLLQDLFINASIFHPVSTVEYSI